MHNPADAETDDFYATLTNEELGVHPTSSPPPGWV
jgi:hypothetical protein